MTRSESAALTEKMREMRRAGMTYAAIAKSYNMNAANVHHRLNTEPKPKTIYKGLNDWMRKNRLNVSKLAERMGMTEIHDIERFRSQMSGRYKITLDTIRKILRMTGMSFEEAFGCEDDDLPSRRRECT